MSFVFKERICKLSWIVIYKKIFVRFERFVFVLLQTARQEF